MLDLLVLPSNSPLKMSREKLCSTNVTSIGKIFSCGLVIAIVPFFVAEYSTKIHLRAIWIKFTMMLSMEMNKGHNQTL